MRGRRSERERSARRVCETAVNTMREATSREAADR